MAYGKAVCPVQTRLKDKFALLAEDVEVVITDRTKIILLNFPTNPTGAVEPLDQLEKIAELAVKHDLIVISDEILQ